MEKDLRDEIDEKEHTGMGVGVPLAQEDALRSERIQKRPIDAVRLPLPILARLTVARTRRSIEIVRPGHLYSRERHLKSDASKRGPIALTLGHRPPRARALGIANICADIIIYGYHCVIKLNQGWSVHS